MLEPAVQKTQTEQVAAKKLSDDHLEIHKLAFEQGMNNLSAQESLLGTIRQRAGALIGISGLTAAVLGREALSSGLSIFAWVAIVGLIGTVAASIQMIRPRGGWNFHFGPSRIIDQFAQGEQATNLSRTYEVLARFAEENHNNNSRRLRELFTWLWIAMAGLLIQIVAWLLAI